MQTPKIQDWKNPSVILYLKELRYLKEKKQIKPLSPEREIELTQKARDGDYEARKEFIESNLGFVVFYVEKNSHRWPKMPISDMIDLGNYGLIEAAGRFDETKGFRFISYAVWWIQKKIREAYFEEYTGFVRRSTNIQEKAGKIARIDEEYISNNEGMNAPEWYLRKALGKNPDGDDDIRQSIAYNEKSLDDHVHEDGNINNYDIIENPDSVNPESQIDNILMKLSIEKVLKTLEKIESQILIMHYGLDGKGEKSLKQIGIKLGYAESWIEKIENMAISKLRYKKRMKILKPELYSKQSFK